MKIKSLLVFFNCCVTLLYQVIYHYVPASDALRYLRLAKEYTHLDFSNPVTNCYGHPLYASFLAVIGTVVSYHPYVIGFIQSLLFGIVVVLLTGELEKLLNRKLTGLMLLLFLVPEVNLYNGYILTESLSSSLIILSFYAGLKIYNGRVTTGNLLLLSFFIGVNMLNRLECAVVIFPILYLIFPKIKPKLLSSVLIILSFPIMLPQLNGIRNDKIFHKYNIGSFNGGEVIYGGNNENLDGSHHVFHGHKEIFIPKNKIEDYDKILSLEECYSCPKRDSFYLELAFDAWKRNPIEQAGVIPLKVAKNWLLPGNFDAYTSDTTKARGLLLNKVLSKEYFKDAWYAPYKHLFYLIIHWILLSIIIVGLFRMDFGNRFQKTVLILLIFYILFAIPFCGLPRWHVTIFPLLILTFTPSSLAERMKVFLERFIPPKSALICL